MHKRPSATSDTPDGRILHHNYLEAVAYLNRCIRDHRVKLQALHDGTHTTLSAHGVKLVEASLAECLEQLAGIHEAWQRQIEQDANNGNKVTTITTPNGRQAPTRTRPTDGKSAASGE